MTKNDELLSPDSIPTPPSESALAWCMAGLMGTVVLLSTFTAFTFALQRTQNLHEETAKASMEQELLYKRALMGLLHVRKPNSSSNDSGDSSDSGTPRSSGSTGRAKAAAAADPPSSNSNHTAVAIADAGKPAGRRSSDAGDGSEHSKDGGGGSDGGSHADAGSNSSERSSKDGGGHAWTGSKGGRRSSSSSDWVDSRLAGKRRVVWEPPMVPPLQLGKLAAPAVAAGGPEASDSAEQQPSSSGAAEPQIP